MRNLDELVQKIKANIAQKIADGSATFEQVELLGITREDLGLALRHPVDDLREMTAPLTEKETVLMQDVMLSFREPDPVIMARGALNRHERRALVSRRRKGY